MTDPVHHPGRPQNDARRLLITGIGGFLGSHLAELATDVGWEVSGVTRATPTDYPPVAIDLAEDGATRDAIERCSPDAVIHCAANARTNECERHPELAERDNVLATRLLAQACADDRPPIPLVVCSTDLVFDGTRPGGMYRENDDARPVNVYGRSKLAMEQVLHEMGSHAIIARLPLLFGPPAHSGGKGSFLSGWVEHLRAGKPLVLFTDEWRTPLSARDAARGLLECLDKGQPGETYHLCGKERVNRHDIGIRFARHADRQLGFDAALLQAGKQADVPMTAPRAADVSLDGMKALRGLDFDAATLDNEIAWTVASMASVQ
ncbi:MAG: SDR family oxidoreductase [Phycisphaerales bacterium]